MLEHSRTEDDAYEWRDNQWWAFGELGKAFLTRDRQLAETHTNDGDIVYPRRDFKGAVHVVRRRIHCLQDPDDRMYYVLPNARITTNWDDALEEYTSRKLEHKSSVIFTTLWFDSARKYALKLAVDIEDSDSAFSASDIEA
ncbi:hypothetical protein C8R44DRAFT_727023 [Mycena epipterygia]|nr:hypothetical protein C8R44DRAFT_727023 [Mycena epipterygia]